MFHDLMLNLNETINFNKIGFYVSHHFNYFNFIKSTPTFDENEYRVLKEWEIVNNSLKEEINYNILTKYEKRLSGFNLWDSIVGDRHIYFGKRSTLFQDYKSRFNKDQMLKILQGGLIDIDDFLNKNKPDFIIGYNSITFGENLFYYFAKSMNIPFLNLRSLKIGNHVAYGETIDKHIYEIKELYDNYMSTNKDVELLDKANSFILNANSREIKYEGIRKRDARNKITLLIKGLSSIPRRLKKEIIYYSGGFHRDNQSMDPLIADFYNKLINPIRAFLIDRKLSKQYIKEKNLLNFKYAFFPLHSEPEVSIMLHNKTYINQIEAIRLFSHNLPIDMILIVKDHPVAHGKRTLNYYRKILEIPNVKLVNPRMNTLPLIENSQLITNLAGSVAFEAILKGKPVISLGSDHHDILPYTMIRLVKSLKNLFSEICDLLQNYSFDEKALKCFIAASMKNSIKVNLYSSLLGRPNREIPKKFENNYNMEIEKLSLYTLKKIQDLKKQPKQL